MFTIEWRVFCLSFRETQYHYAVLPTAPTLTMGARSAVPTVTSVAFCATAEDIEASSMANIEGAGAALTYS